MAGDDSQGDAGTADTGRFPRPASDAGAGADEVEVTGKFTAHDFEAVEESAVRPADEPPPSGPPSMGIIATGAFPVYPKEPAAPPAEEDPRAASVVQLRFYAGLSIDETASALDSSRARLSSGLTSSRACRVRASRSMRRFRSAATRTAALRRWKSAPSARGARARSRSSRKSSPAPAWTR